MLNITVFDIGVFVKDLYHNVLIFSTSTFVKLFLLINFFFECVTSLSNIYVTYGRIYRE